MLLNNENFKIYPMDTKDTIFARIAVKLKTTLDWLFVFNEEDIFDENANIRAIDMFKYISEIAPNIYTFYELENDNYVKSWRKTKEDALENIVKLYIILYYKKEIKDGDFINEYFTIQKLSDFFSESDSDNLDFDFEFISDTIQTGDEFLKNHEEEILKIKTIEKEIDISRKKNVNFNIETSEFLIQEEISIFKIQIPEEIIMENILNNINNTIFSDNYKLLLAQYNDIVSISKENIKIIEEYGYEFVQNSLNIILFKPINPNDLSFRKINFREINIKKESRLTYIVSIHIEKSTNINDISLIFNIDPVNIEIIDTKEKKLTGKYTIYNTSFDKILFLDCIMSNPVFYNIYYNERKKLGKNYTKLHLVFTSEYTNNVNIKLHQENNNIEVFIIKTSSVENANKIIDELVFLIGEYKYDEKQLYEEYIREIPDFTMQKIEVSEKIKGSKSIASELMFLEPKLFLNLYSRKCAKPPRILKDGEIPPDNYEIMEFPLYGEGDLQKRKYICDNSSTHRYPGLRKNSLINNNIFPYIPCCYETSQLNRTGSGLNAYINNKEKEVFERYDHNIYKTLRILPNQNQGILPKGILYALGDNAIRNGVYIGPNSFIDSVLRVSIQNLPIYSQTQHLKLLRKIRSLLNWEVCLQENSDINNKKLIKSWFYNNNMYFEPRRFYRALEEYFNVNIYFFERSTNYVTSIENEDLFFTKTTSPNGILGIPNIPEKGPYIFNKKFKKTIFVYVHMGSPVDILQNPQVEYITGYNEDSYYIVKKIFQKMLGNYIIAENNINKNNIEAQLLDNTGRVRKILSKGRMLDLTFPSIPLDVPIIEEIKDENVKNNDYFKNYLYIKRLARILLEYCLINYANSDLYNINEFINKNTKVLNNFEYKQIYSDLYKISDYDNIFKENGIIIFNSEDTKERIIYSMKIIEKRTKMLPYKNTSVISSYYNNILDFDNDSILTEDIFDEIIYGFPQGEIFNNFLTPTNSEIIIMTDVKYKHLNGYFKVFPNIISMNEYINNNSAYYSHNEKYDTWYVWKKISWSIYSVEIQPEKLSKVVVVYKISGKLYILLKTLNIMINQ